MENGSGGSGDGSGRRVVLQTMIAAGSVAFGAALGAPAVVFVAAPLRRPDGAVSAHWVPTLRLESLQSGVPKKVALVADERDAWAVAKNVELGAVWLVRRGDRVDAYSVVCPHLGCAVQSRDDGTFACPCHTSAFDAQGKRVSGPSPRDMDRLETRITNGIVDVDFRRFRIGVPEREEVG